MPEQIRPECLVHCTLTKRERVGWGGGGGVVGEGNEGEEEG